MTSADQVYQQARPLPEPPGSDRANAQGDFIACPD
jgi:hypothetical protein